MHDHAYFHDAECTPGARNYSLHGSMHAVAHRRIAFLIMRRRA
ncbi:hypothetical protein BRPE64_DCDS08410 (plasmid) [Caballeronia insecticola]|uniref:Uncharacterized protein n=1 Tax=Caballeronia insecticola TaxID=758793 RepID=R4X511_9BURK|nr:hypothetical protein BRPE64_DCDS08410 [Caballeronia insecticola]